MQDGRDQMSGADADSPMSHFEALGISVQVDERQLWDELMEAGHPGQASFYVPGRTYICVTLGTYGPGIYSYGETTEIALARALARFKSEQR